MKNWISAVAGVLLTACMAYDLNHAFDWSGGAGQTPREFVARNVELAYTQGQSIVT
jgi:hypothetical protein